MVTVRKEFLPRVLAVPAGSKVRFPNQDPILHNVFSVSGENRFDLGLYKQGEAKEAHLLQAGMVNVFCNVHHSMVGYIAVLETPFTRAPRPTANSSSRVCRPAPAPSPCGRSGPSPRPSSSPCRKPARRSR